MRLSKSNISKLEKDYVLNILDVEFLGMGTQVKKFEEALSAYFSSNVVCVNTGTSALQLALQAVGVGPGDEVITPSLTYVATFQAISATGAIPVPCEVDEATLQISISDIENRITKKTKAICPVHYTGMSFDIERLYTLAKKHHLRVVEDAAHAFGSTYNGKLIGSFGDVICFSFDGIKNITSGEGGAVVSSDLTVIKKIQDLRLLGVVGDSEKRYNRERSWEFDVQEQGWRYHMSEIMAAIGLAQLERFPEFIKIRRSIIAQYLHELKKTQGIELLPYDLENVVPHIFVIKVKNGKRDALRDFLQSKSIPTGIHYYPNHRLSYYKKIWKKEIKLPIVDRVYDEILTLPLHTNLNSDDIKKVTNTVKEYLNQGK